MELKKGDEFVSVYNKERLMEYIRVTTPITKIEKDELNIISGALSLNTKTVVEVTLHVVLIKIDLIRM